ncbi:cation diffusion facilitator family transporter [Fictibacillus nanhaiensis]|uniref:cation diffusion facilitator family transporter n=1 Tax=Fictibacillus nanhaiensis TaxID=742169 RepID=UPI001C95351F|nr:cation diffusion facilitator family transporter [Fictibacillus nanhaiensis]MBY6036273.1 cation diffusion facilitator family transporter [Fictibacillus nanhaiensis]
MQLDQQKRVERGVYLSLGAYIFLSIIKLISGFVYHSDALIADGLNNATDIIASMAVLIGLKISRKPADEDHPYGHLRAETIASMVASFIMVVIGIEVLISSIKKVVRGVETEPSLTAAIIAIFGAAVMFCIYFYNMKVAKETDSQGLKAAALDNRSDAFVSIGAAVGIFGSQIGLAWLDPAAAVLVGLIIIKTGWEIFTETSHNLSDGFDYEEGKEMEHKILDVDGVENVGDLKARKHGNRAIIDVTIKVNPSLNVIESHEITEKIEDTIKEAYNVESIQVHVEPEDGEKQN